MDRKFFNYITTARQSEFMHPTRTNIITIFYRLAQGEIKLDEIDDLIIEQLNGTTGTQLENSLDYMRILSLNICFYFCEFLLSAGVDSELVYASSDYFILECTGLKNFDDCRNLIHTIAEVMILLYKRRDEHQYSGVTAECVKYVNHHLNEKICLSDIADSLGRTPQYLTTQFRKTTGETLYNYISRRKMEEAKFALENSDISVITLADSLGYASASYFTAAFRKVTGLTPTEYRANGHILKEYD